MSVIPSSKPVRHSSPQSARVLGVALVIAACSGSCSSPLSAIDEDYVKRPPIDRLRALDRLDRDKYRAPEGEKLTSDVPAPGKPYKSPFEGLESATITLADTRAAVLSNNLDLKVVLLDPTIRGEALRQEEAKFEAVFRPSTTYSFTNSPTFDPSRPADPTRIRSLDFGAGVDIPLRSGGRASVDLLENKTDTLAQTYTSSLTFTLSQPLLRGAGRRANTNSIRIAALNRDIAETQTKLEVIRQIANADRAYWRIYAARKTLEVRQKQYELAIAQLERAKRRFDAGDAPELEVTRAQSGAASQLDQIIQAERNVLDTQREFKRLVNIPGLGVETKTQIIPGADPDPVRFEFVTNELAELGVANRMEMLELELRLAQDYSNIEFAKNQSLPQFLLDFAYTVPGRQGTFSASIDQLSSFEFQNWRVSLRGEIPLGNEAAIARVQQAILTRLQRLSTKEARRLSIQSEVLGAIDAINASWQSIVSTRQSVILAARTYEGERRQFEAGARTSTDVLDAAARLADEQTREVQALTNYEIAQVELAVATGTLIGATRIDWSPSDPRALTPNTVDPTPPAIPFYDSPETRPVPVRDAPMNAEP